LKWIIEYWSDLHKTEREQIFNLIESDREDLRWIKAVILNSYSSTPKELTQSILGTDKLNYLRVKDVIQLFPKQLLEDCLNVYCGSPQPLWWLAVHHHNREFWGKVIRNILENESNIGFEVCLQEFLINGVNTFGDDWADWEIIWTKLCKDITNKQLLAKTLTYNTAKCSCNLYYANKLWSILINGYKEVERENEIIEFVAQNIELLQQTGHKEDLFKIFNESFLVEVIKKLQLDYLIYELLQILTSEYSSKLEQKIKEILDNIDPLFKYENIRFFGTFNYIDNSIKDDKIPKELKSKLKSLPNLIDEIGEKEFKKLKDTKEYELENWIGIN